MILIAMLTKNIKKYTYINHMLIDSLATKRLMNESTTIAYVLIWSLTDYHSLILSVATKYLILKCFEPLYRLLFLE